MHSENDAFWRLVGGEVFGAKPDATGPLGGGAGYASVVTTGDHVVSDVRGLIRALAAAVAGQVVFVESGAEIDLTDRVITHGQVLRIPAGVTLAGDRGLAGSRGGLIFSDEFKTVPLIEAAGPGVRVTGLRLRGPDPKRRLEFHYRVFYEEKGAGDGSELYYRFPNSRGIHTTSDRLEIDNCEISAWSHTGIYLENGKGHRVHHNFIHHCQRMGLGYGITHNFASESVIEFNVFQDNKHHIAGTGSPGQVYEARHNVVLAPTESYIHPIKGGEYGQDHLFDMHGGRDRVDGTEIAGDRLSIHHNTFVPPYLGICIRGYCEHGAEIHHNWFQARGVADESIVGDGRIDVGPNLHGIPPWLGTLRGAARVLTPPGVDAAGTPGQLEARLKNIGPAPAAATLRLNTFPDGMLAGSDDAMSSVELAAGEEHAIALPLALTPAGRARGAFTVQLASAAGGVTDASGLRLPLTNVRVTGRRLSDLSSDNAIPGWADAQQVTPVWSIKHAGESIAEARFASTGAALLVHARVRDRNPARGPHVWDGACFEVFAARAAGDEVHQLLLAPADATHPAAAFRGDPKAPQPEPRIAVESRIAKDGYEIMAVIPFACLGLAPDADALLLEFQASRSDDAGKRVHATLFGSDRTYATAEGYAHFTVRS